MLERVGEVKISEKLPTSFMDGSPIDQVYCLAFGHDPILDEPISIKAEKKPKS